MTDEQIKELWNEASGKGVRLRTFARLVEARTREECARIVEQIPEQQDWGMTEYADVCAAAIRGMK